MNKTQKNYPCICGHSFKEHSEMYCYVCFVEDVYNEKLIQLGTAAKRGSHSYVRDNLKFLEQKLNDKS